MSHQAFPKPTGLITDGYVLTFSNSEGFWKPAKIGNAPNSVFSSVTTDISTNSTVYSDLISGTITTNGGEVLVIFSLNGLMTGGTFSVYCKLVVDGVTQPDGGCWTTQPNNQALSCGAVFKLTGLSAASHTIKYQWKVDSGGTMLVNASSVSDTHGANLFIEELNTGNNGQPAGGDLSGTFPNPTVIKIQGRTINSAAPDDGYLLTYSNADGYWAARKSPRATSGLSTNRPGAVGSGALYIADDINVIFLDDPATSTWKSYHSVGYTPNTFPTVGNFTVVGSMGVSQRGESILASTQTNNKDCHGLAAWPGGVPTGGPWVLTLSGSWSFTRASTYPSFGVLISNGVTASSSLGLFMGYYNFNSNTPSPGVWTITLNTQTRPSVYAFDNGFTADTSPSYFRIINDGTNYIYQFSQMKGSFWRTFFTNTTATVGITPTHYGFSLGCTNTAGFASALVDGISLNTLSQTTITSVTSDGTTYTVTTSGAHNLMTGDSISITSVTGTGTSPNNRYENTVISTGTNTFTVPAGGTFTYTSGGLVTLTSR